MIARITDPVVNQFTAIMPMDEIRQTDNIKQFSSWVKTVSPESRFALRHIVHGDGVAGYQDERASYSKQVVVHVVIS